MLDLNVIQLKVSIPLIRLSPIVFLALMLLAACCLYIVLKLVLRVWKRPKSKNRKEPKKKLLCGVTMVYFINDTSDVGYQPSWLGIFATILVAVAVVGGIWVIVDIIRRWRKKRKKRL